jgi:hypothetical protein
MYKDTWSFYKKCMPKILSNEGNILVPPPMYLHDLECYAVAAAYEKKVDEDGNEYKEFYWRQPIIIMQNRYPSTMLNDWDGNLNINKDSGTIMSAMIGAGRKNNNNTFSGVLMGDVGVEAGMTLHDGDKSGLGIYGFHEGA